MCTLSSQSTRILLIFSLISFWYSIYSQLGIVSLSLSFSFLKISSEYSGTVRISIFEWVLWILVVFSETTKELLLSIVLGSNEIWSIEFVYLHWVIPAFKLKSESPFDFWASSKLYWWSLSWNSFSFSSLDCGKVISVLFGWTCPVDKNICWSLWSELET